MLPEKRRAIDRPGPVTVSEVPSRALSGGAASSEHEGAVSSRGRLIWLGAVIVVAMAGLSGIDGRQDTVAFLVVAFVASTAFLGAAWTVVRATPPNVRGLWICFALALAGRLPLLVAPPTVSDDIYRYIWDGRIQRLGYSPYMSAPGDPALQHLHTAVTRRTAHPTIRSFYPPAAEWFFRGVATLHESVLAFKAALVACDLLVGLLLLRWLARSGQSPWRVLLYVWNPLVMIEVAGSGHVDVLGACLLVLCFLALTETWLLVAAAAFVTAVEVKFLPVVLLPLLWRRVRRRDVALACLVGLVLAVPFALASGGLPLGSLPAYLEKWRFNGPAFALIEQWVGGRWLPLLPAGLGLITAACVRRRGMSLGTWAWPMAAALLLMPTVYPWYLVWLAPFLGAPETAPLLVWTQSSLLTYYVWRVAARGGGWVLPGWVTAAEFGSVTAVAIWAVASRARWIEGRRQP